MLVYMLRMPFSPSVPTPHPSLSNLISQQRPGKGKWPKQLSKHWDANYHTGLRPVRHIDRLTHSPCVTERERERGMGKKDGDENYTRRLHTQRVCKIEGEKDGQ